MDQLPNRYSINTRSIAIFPDFRYCQHHRKQDNNSSNNLKNNQHNGRISSAARKKIQQYINYIDSTSEWKQYYSESDQMFFSFRVNFITLTLPSTQIHTDNFIKRNCLGQFITEMKTKHPEVRYFWRAEKQDNGNIHFHLLTNIYYHYEKIRNDWNRIINKYGYVDSYTNSFNGITFKSYFAKMRQRDNATPYTMRKRWEAGKAAGWISPNTTDVHAIKNVKDVASYVGKYCTKDTITELLKGYQQIKSKLTNGLKYKVTMKEIIEYRSKLNIIEGKQYGCDNYTKKYSKILIDQCPEVEQLLKEITTKHQYSIYKTDECTIIKADIHYILLKSKGIFPDQYREHTTLYLTAHLRGDRWFQSPFHLPPISTSDPQIQNIINEINNINLSDPYYKQYIEYDPQVPIPF